MLVLQFDDSRRDPFSPFEHVLQDDDPVPVWYLPEEQKEQYDDPFSAEKLPTEHATQILAPAGNYVCNITLVVIIQLLWAINTGIVSASN